MSIDALKKELKDALIELIEAKNFNAESAYRMQKQHAKLKQDATRSRQDLLKLDRLLKQAEQENKPKKERDKIGDNIAAVKKERNSIQGGIRSYQDTMASRKAKETEAEQKLQKAIDALRHAEGKQPQAIVPKNSNKSEQARLALKAHVLQERIQNNEMLLDVVQGELKSLLGTLSLKLREGGSITYETLQSELRKVQQGESSNIVTSNELKNLAGKFYPLSAEVELLDSRLNSIEQSRKNSGLFRFFYPLLSLFLGYARDEARQKTLQKEKQEAKVFSLFYEAHDLMLERVRIRKLEVDHERTVCASQKTLANEKQQLLDLRRDFHAYCSDIDRLDASEQPRSGSIAIDKAAVATSTFVTNAASEVQKWSEQAATDISRGVQDLQNNPEKTLKKVGAQLGDAATDLWNRWRLHQPKTSEQEEQRKPLLSGRVQHVAKALRVFLGEPSTINLELLVHCMDENPTYSVDAPEGFKLLLNQAADFYPELGARIKDMSHAHTSTKKFQ